MIDHSTCTHERTPRARSACRRARARDGEVGFGAPLWSLGPPPKVKAKKDRASTKEVDLDPGAPKTPRDKFNECHVCGVERILYSGTDRFLGFLVFVGDKCRWRVKDSTDFVELP